MLEPACQHSVAQFSTINCGTRQCSWVLFVTYVKPRAKA
jgi:hypothetical protein